MTSNAVQQPSDSDTLHQTVEDDWPQAQHSLEDCLCFESLLTELSRIFVKAPAEDIDRAIQQGLQQVVECLGGDRSTFIEFSADLSQFHLPHSYVLPGLPDVKDSTMDSEGFPWCVDRLQHGKAIRIFEMDELPLDAEVDKQGFRHLGVRSVVILPVTMDETVLCALTVATLRETRRWDETFVQRLHLLSEIFANGLARKRAWQQQEERLQIERLIADLSAEFITMPPHKVDASINTGLTQVVASLPGVDRSTFAEFSSDRTHLSVTHSAVKPELSPYPPGRVNNVFPWATNRLRSGELVRIAGPDDFPEEASIDREAFLKFELKAAVIAPIRIDGSVRYSLTISSLHSIQICSEVVIRRLQVIGEIFANALIRKQAWQQQEERLRVERLIADLSAEFIAMPLQKVDEGIQAGLKQLAKCLPGADRFVFGEFSSDRTLLSATHAAAVSVTPYPLGPVNEAMPWVVDRLRCGETVRITGADEFPEEARIDRDTFLTLGLKATTLVPLRVGGSVRFVLSVGSSSTRKICSDEVLQRLQVMGEIFANAQIRKHNEESLNTALADLQQLRDRLQSENLYLQEEIQLRSSYGEIIGESPTMQAVLRQIEQVADTDSTVLIQGETGSGKELIAQTTHRLSARKQRPMMTVNCAALPPTLIESALFGHEKGAFTGALRKKTGYFEFADNSTIFLDEIGELPLELQAKLLRVLESGQFERLGSTQTITVDVRVIAATNQKLFSAVEKGAFREDLYYRLHVFPLHVPPLRERPQDIPLLVWAFVRHFAQSMNKRIESIPRKAMQALQRYSWPGNVRELRNVIEHAMIISRGTILTVPPPEAESPEASFSSDLSLDDVMRQHILAVLERSGWRVSGKQGAAEILGLKATTLEARMKKLGITRPT